VKTVEFSDEFADRSKVRDRPEAAVGVQNLQTAAFAARVLQSRPSPFGHVQPKCRQFWMRKQ
jgi:hypothetical protein